MSHINTIENTTTPTQTDHCFTNLVDSTILPTLFSDSEAIAALACAEVLRHSKLDPQLLDNLLIQALHENLLYDEWCAEKPDSIEYLAKLLLPQVKNTLQYFYTYSKDNDAEFDEILKTTQQECDYDFLQLVTKIFSKAYLREIKRCKINTSN